MLKTRYDELVNAMDMVGFTDEVSSKTQSVRKGLMIKYSKTEKHFSNLFVENTSAKMIHKESVSSVFQLITYGISFSVIHLLSEMVI